MQAVLKSIILKKEMKLPFSNNMNILAIETSCDETAAAIIQGSSQASFVKCVSQVLSTSLTLHAKTGGIIPENAARQQLKCIIPVLDQTLDHANMSHREIDAIAVTIGPGLIGSLLVGVETAKTLAYSWNKPIIPVNHLLGHIYANFVRENSIPIESGSKLHEVEFPAIALIVSGGHTDLVYIKRHGSIQWLGGTRDDAAGEALDKIGRMLDLPYPAGPSIEQLAQQGNTRAFDFPRPMINSLDFDFSFSGLKTAVYRKILGYKEIKLSPNKDRSDICASVQQAIFDVLIKKTLNAVQKYHVKSILLSGGVTANQTLRKQFEWKMKNAKLKIKLFAPAKSLCTDNAAMIGSWAFYNSSLFPWNKITANPELYFY